jgi:formate hydrogenlyase subunit 6/NADH:ubiquinone oxidoreductase subunit I
MSRLHSLVYLLPELWRTLLTQPITVGFPFRPLELPPYFQGKVTIDPTMCTGCGLCVRDCPAFALELEQESRNKFKIIHYPDRCAYCGQCETSCRFGAATLINEFIRVTPDCDTLRGAIVERDETYSLSDGQIAKRPD